MTLRIFLAVLMAGLFLGAAAAPAVTLVTESADTAPALHKVATTHKAASSAKAASKNAATKPASSKSPASHKVAAPRDNTEPATTRKSSSADHDKIPAQLRVNLAWQIALEAADFSPGILDGHFGRKSELALKEYAARYFPGKDKYDADVYLALDVNTDDAIVPYTITSADAALIGPLPDDWNEKAKLDRLTYDTMIDCITEKFHCTRGLLQTLNPNMKFKSLDVGQTLLVPNIRPFPAAAAEKTAPASTRAADKADRVEINLAEKTLRVYDKNDGQVALYHCSVAKDKAKLPDRDAVVRTVAVNPEYKFDPKYWPEVNNVDRILIIKPGPRNPVGVVWIGLDLPGYGIHGNPKPELIGKTGSHGCFRLTNWDALKLVNVVKVGMTVKMINPEKDGAKEEKD